MAYPMAAAAGGHRRVNRSDLRWAVERWQAEVQHRPLTNIYRRTLDTVWRQGIRRAGGDDVALCGLAHGELLDAEREP